MAVGSFTEVPVIVEAAGAALVGAPVEPDSLDGTLSAAAGAFDGLDVIEDLNGSADYKRHLAWCPPPVHGPQRSIGGDRPCMTGSGWHSW